MVLSQFVITSANNNTIFPVGISGKCSIRVLHIEYADGGANAHRVIKLVSDSLVFPYSSARYLTWLTNPHAEVAVDQGRTDYHLSNVIINGGIRLQVLDTDTEAEPAGFVACIVTLSIEEINRNLVVGQ